MAESTQTPLPLIAGDVEAARERLRGVVDQTLLVHNARLSALTGAEVWLKREDLQPVRSYKSRGAFNLIAQLSDDARGRGVVCASAGNHAQGVAFACRRLGVDARIYVPTTTPRQKRERIIALGGDRVALKVVGETYDDAYAATIVDAERSGATLVHAFDHPATIAGQGTIAAEIVDQLGSAPDVLVVPVGGGGLLAGVMSWMGPANPGTRVVGVEPEGAACMAAALENGSPLPLADLDTFVDGAAVRTAGVMTTRVVASAPGGRAAEMVTVPVGGLCTEIIDLYQSDGVIAEPAGALASAALRRAAHVEPGSTVVCVVSGGNNDISRYDEIIERSLIHEGLKHYFLVTFPQEPGALRRFLDDVLGPEDDITLFDYVKRNNRETGPALIGVELARPEDFDGLMSRIAAGQLDVEHIEPGSPLFHYVM